MAQKEVLEACVRDFQSSATRSYTCPYCTDARIIKWQEKDDERIIKYPLCNEKIKLVTEFSDTPKAYMNQVYKDALCPYCDVALTKNVKPGECTCPLCEKKLSFL